MQSGTQPSRWALHPRLRRALLGGAGPARLAHFLAPVYFVGFATFLFLFHLHNHPMWTDAWRLHELSQTIFGAFYRSNIVATFQSDNVGWQSADFPPLWPVVLSITDKLLHTGLNSGFVAGFLCLALFMSISEAIARELTGVRWVGLAVVGILIASWWFQTELLAGQTMPMQLLLMSLILYVLLDARPLSASRSFCVGALCGVAFLNRFDALLFGIGMVFACGWAAKSWRAGAMAVLGLGLAMSPWIVYSLTYFNTPLASDNKAIALAAVITHTTEWYAAPLPTVFDQPLTWLLKLVRYGGRLSVGLVQSFLGVAALPVVFLAGLAVRASTSNRREGQSSDPRQMFARVASLGPQGLRFGLFGIALWLSLCAQLLTGYGYQARYFAPHVWWVGLGAMMLGLRIIARSEEERRAATALFLALAMVATAVTWLAERRGLEQSWSPGSSGRMTANADYNAVAECVRRNGGRRILALDNEHAVRLAVLTAIPSVAAPTNFGRLSAAEIGLFMAKYKIDFVVAFTPEEEQAFVTRWPAQRLASCTPIALDVRRRQAQHGLGLAETSS